MTNFWRKVVVRLGYLAAGLLILAAVLVSVARLLTPLLNDHRTDFEALATRLLDRPVQIGEMDISWDFYEPELEFRQVIVLDPKTHQPTVHIPSIKVDVAIWNSLFQRTFLLDSLKVTGARLTLREQKPGKVGLEGFNQFFLMTDNVTGQSLNPNAVLTWIFSQPKLILQHFEIHYFPYEGDEKSVTLKRLTLSNASRDHQLKGSAVLNQTIPTQVAIDFNWKGDVTDLSHISAKLSLNLQNISVPQWFSKKTWHGLQLKQGIGSAKVQAKWNNNAWQHIQTNFEFYDVEGILDSVFANPLEFDELTGSLTLQKDANNAWLLTANNIQAINQDVSANADVSMILPENDSPHINLIGHFTSSHVKKISDYLPLKIYAPDLRTWLRSAFLDGQVTSGNVLLEGKLSDFPFDNGKGKFEIGGVVKEVELRYAPDWPTMDHIDGKLLFSGRSMTIDVLSAQLLNIPLHDVHGEIPNLGNPILTIKSTIQTDLIEGLGFIQQSPLKKTIGKDLSTLKLQGPMQLALSLAIPLDHAADAKVTGDTTISGATLTLPTWNLGIDSLSGTFHFTEDSIAATDLVGQLLGHSVTLNLSTQYAPNKTKYVMADLQGMLDTAEIQSWLDVPIEKVMQGTTHYKAELILPPQHVSSSQSTQMTIQSDLQGIAVDLPAEYGKKSEDPADFQMNFFIQNNQPIKVKMKYNKLFSLAMVLQREKEKLTLFSADLQLGNGEANWPTQSGVIITGNLDQVNWDDIAPSVSQFTAKPKSSSTTNEWMNPDLFRAVDLHVKVVRFSGYQLNNLRIQLSKTANQFVLGLENADMAGQIMLPRSGIEKGIQANFQRLNLSNMGNEKTAMDPRRLPPISFVGEDVRYGDMRLGHVVFNMVPMKEGMEIKQLNLTLPAYQLQATGTWTNTRSRLEGHLSTKNISDFLNSWGFSSTSLVGSTGDADFNLNWPGALLHPSLSGLSGNISLKLGEGRIINLGNATDAKMGLGRLLNILSLQSLPRRLSLNFSDLSQKGYSFESMKGDFTFQNGSATTQNTRFEGSIARIDIAGRIGLVAKDLNMKISVTPYVTSSLPVVAAIATANPIAGVATWVVDKMVSPAVSQMTTYHYSITGSWSEPVWEQVK